MVDTHRFTEMKPAEIDRRLEIFPVAIVPWGALEWHGPHLPFGLDGLVAQGFSERLARQTGAVLFPPYYLPITSLPHPYSISTKPDLVAALWEDLFDQIGAVGFQLICLVSGHYAQGHEWVLSEVAEHVSQRGPTRVLAATPLALLGDPDLLDHAARYETAQLLALRPELVDLDSLPPAENSTLEETAVLGQDPRSTTAEEGEQLLDRALREWGDWIDRLLSSPDPSPLLGLYQARRDSYQSYVDRYYDGSWEQAIRDWWRDATG